MDKNIAEGRLLISINDIQLSVYYQAPEEFINEYIAKLPCQKDIDLWLVYGQGIINECKEKTFPNDIKICGGIFKGIVVEVKSEDEFTLDCGLLIDVQDEGNPNFKKGDYIKTSGTYQIYFEETNWTR